MRARELLVWFVLNSWIRVGDLKVYNRVLFGMSASIFFIIMPALFFFERRYPPHTLKNLSYDTNYGSVIGP